MLLCPSMETLSMGMGSFRLSSQVKLAGGSATASQLRLLSPEMKP